MQAFQIASSGPGVFKIAPAGGIAGFDWQACKALADGIGASWPMMAEFLQEAEPDIIRALQKKD